MTTVQATVHSNGYSGIYGIAGLGVTPAPKFEWFCADQGRAQVHVAPGRYSLYVSHGANFDFHITAEGTLVSDTPDGLQCLGTAMHLLTREIEIDPDQYLGAFRIEGVERFAKPGRRKYIVIAGLVSSDPEGGYILRLEHSNAFRFNVNGSGSVSLNKYHAGAAFPQGATLRLNHVNVRITPEIYDGPWQIRGAEASAASGSRTVTLVPCVKGYILEVRPGIVGYFDLNPQGMPSPPEIPVRDGNNTWMFRLARA